MLKKFVYLNIWVIMYDEEMTRSQTKDQHKHRITFSLINLLSLNYLLSYRNNKKRENLEYFFITCIFPKIKLKSGFRISCSVIRKLFEESTTNALTPNLLEISAFLGFLKSGGGGGGI